MLRDFFLSLILVPAILVLVSSKADPETRICMQVVNFAGDFRKHKWKSDKVRHRKKH